MDGCFFTLVHFYPSTPSWVFLLIPLIMGFTRIYFVVHYTTDVLGAILVGGLSALISYFAIKYIVKAIESKNKINYQNS